MANEMIPSNPGEFLIYKTEDGRTRVQVRFEGETVWLSQRDMAELFQKDVRTISEHIRNIFDEAELQPESVVRNFRITAADNKQYDTQHYNLDVINELEQSDPPQVPGTSKVPGTLRTRKIAGRFAHG